MQDETISGLIGRLQEAMQKYGDLYYELWGPYGATGSLDMITLESRSNGESIIVIDTNLMTG